jgi:hypothetical protein
VRVVTADTLYLKKNVKSQKSTISLKSKTVLPTILTVNVFNALIGSICQITNVKMLMSSVKLTILLQDNVQDATQLSNSTMGNVQNDLLKYSIYYSIHISLKLDCFSKSH